MKLPPWTARLAQWVWPQARRQAATAADLPAAAHSFPSLMQNDTLHDAAPISNMAQLAALRPAFHRLRVDLVGSTGAAQACPAQLSDGSMAVFCVPDRIGSDLHRSVLQAAQAHTPERHIATVSVSALLLLTLVRERIEGTQLHGLQADRSHDRSDVARAFRDIVSWAVRKGCSDIHLNIRLDEAESQIHVHVDGHYVAPGHLRMPTERLLEIARVAWLDVVGGREALFDPRLEQQGRLYEVVDGTPYMMRWGSFVADQGPSITLRLLRLSETLDTLSLGSLGYLPSQITLLERAMRSEGGAIVFGGVVGSGKSTSLARLLADLPPTRKIMTIEDPVERIIPNALQASIVRQLSGEADGTSFRTKLMMLKRAAVTDVLLGEIRDTETGQAFLDIVESGTNLYTTVHAGSVAGIPGRLASRQIGVPLDVLAAPGMLKLLVCQALLPCLCPHCALPVHALHEGMPDALGKPRDAAYWRAYIERLQRLYDDVSSVRVRNEAGCPQCRTRGLAQIYGYAGRTAAAEIFEPGHDPLALRRLRRGDALGLALAHARGANQDPRSPDMRGKSAMQCAVHKMLHGQLDPRDIEPRFMAFETLQALSESSHASLIHHV